MAKFETTVHAEMNRVAEAIDKAVISSGLSAEKVEESSCRMGDTRVEVRVYEKYYWRAGNRASLTVTLVGRGDTVFISAIGSGGGQGVLFSFSWGAEDNFVSAVEKAVSEFR